MEIFVGAVVLVFAIALLAVIVIVKDDVKKLVAGVQNLAHVNVNLVQQDSETTQVPFPLAASTCNHFWELVKDEVLETEKEKKVIVIQKCTRCGLIDKTIEGVNREQGCRHKWRITSEVELESAYEQCAKQIKRIQNSKDFYNHWTAIKDGVPSDKWAFRKTYVCTRICESCGEINTIQASNYDIESEE